jgi:hypothetical protein
MLLDLLLLVLSVGSSDDADLKAPASTRILP